MSIIIYTEDDFKKMRVAGKVAAETLDFIHDYIHPGITTSQLNDLCHDFIISKGAVPAILNYKGFPKSICTSINHVVCHGIPSEKKLKNGDIINIDVTVIVDGWYGDTSRMYFVGDVNIKAQRLVNVTYNAMMCAINIIKPGITFGDIGYYIQQYAEKHNYSVVRDYTGHGIGQSFHIEPSVLNYGKRGQGKVVKEGMIFTVEPMINVGGHKTILSALDNWTVTTRDKSLSAQFEHTVGVINDSAEIFTKSPKNIEYPLLCQK